MIIGITGSKENKMKRKVCAGYMFEDEVDAILKASTFSGWNVTETISFFIRWSLQNFKFSTKAEFDEAFNEALVTAQMAEYQKTDAWKKQIEELVKEKQNVRQRESS
jgi:hypothetical protein